MPESLLTLLKKRLWNWCFLRILQNFQEQLFHRTPLDDCFYMFYSNRQVVLWKLLIIYFFLEHFLSTVVTRFNYLKLIICYIYVNNRRHALSLDFDYLTVSWRRPLSYRNQSINLLRKSMDWFPYGNGLRHERVKLILNSKVWKNNRRLFHCRNAFK